MVLDQICYDNEGNSLQYYWCYYQAIDNFTIIIQIIYLITLTIFTAILTHQFIILLQHRKNKQYKQLFGQSFMHVFYIIYAWLICTVVKVIINIVMYYTAMSVDMGASEDGRVDPGSPLVVLSSVFLFFQYGCAYWLLFLMLLIPYIWVNQLLMNTKQNQIIPEHLRKKINYAFNYLKFIQIYYKYIRPWYFVWLVCQPFILFFTTSAIGCNLLKYNAYFIYAESLLTLATYIFGYVVADFMRKNQLLIVSKEDQKRITREYYLLLFVVILRICLNFYFKLSGQYTYQPNSTCMDMINKKQASIFLFLAMFFMHLLPISVILYIYRPNIEDRIRDEMILGNAEIRKSFRAGGRSSGNGSGVFGCNQVNMTLDDSKNSKESQKNV